MVRYRWHLSAFFVSIHTKLLYNDITAPCRRVEIPTEFLYELRQHVAQFFYCLNYTDMEELIPISSNNGQRAVNARDLHSFLGSKQQFADWIKNRITKYDLVENVDYVTASEVYETANGGHSTRTEYALTVDAAKELSMVEGNEKGKQARRYFIECERKLKESGNEALSPAEVILRLAQRNVDNERKMREIERKQERMQSEIEDIRQRTTTDLGRSTIVAYVSRNNIKLDVKRFGAMGRKASTLCKKRDIPVTKIHDVRWGQVSVFPDEILDEVFAAEEKTN